MENNLLDFLKNTPGGLDNIPTFHTVGSALSCIARVDGRVIFIADLSVFIASDDIPCAGECLRMFEIIPHKRSGEIIQLYDRVVNSAADLISCIESVCTSNLIFTNGFVLYKVVPVDGFSDEEHFVPKFILE